jgi:hypothetical protein
MNNTDFKLCYISGDFAYFTTQDISKQWGDDWNDAPYEHNAGTPYEGTEWAIKRLYFEAHLLKPCDYHQNSPWSVERINAGEEPWLKQYDGKPEKLFAGANIEVFCSFVRVHGGGNVYELTELTCP